MKAVLFRFAALVLAFAPPPAGAQEFEKNILTGGPGGTYIQIGRDLAGLAASCGQTLNVRESAGSLENFLGVRKRPFTQFGIVQSDVLEYLKTYESDDPAIARAIWGVQIAFPLYDEEVHVLARRGIESLADLSGRRVAVGAPDSGTFLTASLVMDLAGVEPAERVTINASEALDALLAEEIDAFFYVAGAPASLFADPRIDPERHRLLPIEDPTLQAVYTPAVIEAAAYPWLERDVPLVAVKAVLMTYDFTRGRNGYHDASCDAIAEISHLILTRFDQLRAEGHPKWRDVDLTAIPPGWRIGDCVNEGLAPDYVSQCAPVEPDAPAFEANRVYRDRICASIGC